MRRHVLFAVLLLLGISAVAQNTTKLTEEMQRQLNERTASDEQFRIIITMAEQYDQTRMSRSTQNMDMDQRRAYVINELVNFSQASQADLLKTLNEGKKASIVKDVNPFWIFNGVSCITTREMIYALSERKDIAYIESDEMRNMLPENSLRTQGSAVQTMQTNRDGAPTIAWNVKQVNADKVWTYNGATGYDGSGVIVAVIDTGLDYFHPDIISHIWQPTVNSITVGETTYNLGTFTYQGQTYKLPGYDFVNNDNDPVDDNGHGSHCAGTVAGNGASGIQTGMAPGTTIMALKVLSAAGSGSTTAITNAMEFAIAAGADAVSMSLGGHGLANNATSLSATERAAMVNMLTAGVVALVAAGNEGEYYSLHHPAPSSLGLSLSYYEVPWNVGNPGNCPSPWRHPDQTLDGGHTAVITIGASNRDDRKSTFSSFGPCTWKAATGIAANGYDDYEYEEGDATKIGLIKPDIIVPGSDITSMYYKYNNSTYIGQNNYNNDTTYFAECGTSMATPGAAGITALIIQAYRAKNGVKPTPAQIDEILETTAVPVDFRTNKNNTTGAGRADAKAAIDAIFTQATKPTNFAIGTISGGCVELSWTASTAPKGYAIYRDNEQVGTTTATSYTDKNPGVGKHTYYVRAIDNADIQSVRSNAAVCNVGPYAFADNANITWNDETGTATLGWLPTMSNGNLETGALNYGTQTNTAFTNSRFKSAWWGIRFTPEQLRPYLGMQINSVELYIYKEGVTSTDHIFLEIYRGTEHGNTTGEPVYHREFHVTDVDQWTHVTLDLTAANYISTGQQSGPYVIDDISEDLWITFKDRITAGQEYPISVAANFDADANHTSNCFYMGTEPQGLTLNRNEMCWTHLPDYGTGYNKYALSCKANLVRATTYTDSYTVEYPDATSTETVTGISGNYTKTHIPTLSSGNNTYNITAKLTEGSNTYESCPQDLTIVKVDSDQTISNVDIDQTKVYLVKNNKTLTANNLTCTDVNRLIIDDGSQLVTSSAVSGTVKKAVASFTNSTNGGWKFIASPVATSLAATAVTNLLETNGDYGLFYYDEPTHYWRNYKEGTQGENNTNPGFTIDPQKGYLYASTGQPIAFAGPLQPSDDEVPVSLSYHTNDGENRLPGWNLVGNPFPCNAYTNKSYYVAEYFAENTKTKTKLTMVAASENQPIAPCSGIMVKADAAEQTVGFSKTSYGISTSVYQGNMYIAVEQNVLSKDGASSMPADKAIVSFNAGDELEKFVFDVSDAKLYIPQGDKEYAIAVSETQGEMPVNFKAAENGSYTINVMPENVELSYLHLIDNMTGADVDLLATPDYTFNASVTDYESRFRLVFICGDANDDNGDDDSFAFFSNGQLIVNNSGEATLQVIDLTGRIISSETINGSCSTQINAATGVYMLRLINGNDVKVQKMVVR